MRVDYVCVPVHQRTSAVTQHARQERRAASVVAAGPQAGYPAGRFLFCRCEVCASWAATRRGVRKRGAVSAFIRCT